MQFSKSVSKYYLPENNTFNGSSFGNGGITCTIPGQTFLQITIPNSGHDFLKKQLNY